MIACSWLERFGENIERFAGEAVREKVMEGSTAAEQAGHAEKAAWLSQAFQKLSGMVDADTRTQILQNSSCNCDIHVQKARIAAEKSENMDEFLDRWIWESPIFGDMYRDGETLYVTHPRCVCEWARVADQSISPAFCQCSVGYVKRLFEGALGREVDVDLVKSIAQGDEECKFAVHF
jgi:hypothetical protein